MAPASERDPSQDPDLEDLARDAGRAARRVSGMVAGTTFVLLHAIVGYFTVALGLVAPIWAVAVLTVVWAVAGLVAWRWRSRRPIVTMLVPFAVAALDIGALALGGALLGWQA